MSHAFIFQVCLYPVTTFERIGGAEFAKTRDMVYVFLCRPSGHDGEMGEAEGLVGGGLQRSEQLLLLAAAGRHPALEHGQAPEGEALAVGLWGGAGPGRPGCLPHRR